MIKKIVEKLNKYATVLPDKIPKHCNKRNIVADALGIGDVVILRKALNNPRNLKFYGDLNLPAIDVILTELVLPDKKLFEYTLKAINFNLTDEEFKKLCLIKPTLLYLKKYLEGDKNIPDNILNAIRGAEKNARGY